MTNSHSSLNVAAAASLAALLILGFIALPAMAGTSLHVNLNIGGPGVVWQRPPAMVVVPGTSVSWVQGYADADVYRDGGSWYCYRGGIWYVASGYAGPWSEITLVSVPQEVVYAPGPYQHFNRGHFQNARHDRGPRPGMNRGYHGTPVRSSAPGHSIVGRGPGIQGTHAGHGNAGNAGNRAAPASHAGHAGSGNHGSQGAHGKSGNPGGPSHGAAAQRGGEAGH